LRAAERAVDDWALKMGRVFHHGGEEEAERALEMRSQYQYAYDLFRGTSAEDVLAGRVTEEGDQEFRDEAERLALDPPSHAPASHTWWRRQ
jgi:hypothetical protein